MIDDDDETTAWLRRTADRAELALAVCTGSVLLAALGLLDGRKATTNKFDFESAIPLGPEVDWVRQARWVGDGEFMTSSGVSAGMDMALAALTRLCGREAADAMAAGCEYEWRDDPSWDPFAKLNGLV